MLNKKDRMLIIVVLLIAVISFGISRLKSVGTEVVITLDGETYGRYDITKDEVIYIEAGTGSNTVEIRDGSVSMIEASCPDQICVHTYPISRKEPGTIVCLPHKLIVEIKEK